MSRWMMTLALAASLGLTGAAVRLHATGAAPAAAAQAKADAKVADAVKAAELKRFSSMTSGDYDTLATLLADDLVYTHSDAKVDSKTSYLASLTSGKTKYEVIEPADLQVRVFGSIAVIHGTAKMRVNANGNMLNNALRFTDVWVERGGKWQMTAWQSTRLP